MNSADMIKAALPLIAVLVATGAPAQTHDAPVTTTTTTSKITTGTPPDTTATVKTKTTTTEEPGKITTERTTKERIVETGRTAGRIGSQPAVDVGIMRTNIPPALQNAIAAPYGTKGAATCAQIRGGLRDLNAVLGPDFLAGSVTNENRASKLAEAGGKTIVNSILPFRGLVREVSGAAPAQRRLNAAQDAGYARRGFLRGMARSKACKLG
jgi:hypothetical protein